MSGLSRPIVVALLLRGLAIGMAWSVADHWVDTDGHLLRAHNLLAGQSLVPAMIGDDATLRGPLYPIVLLPAAAARHAIGIAVAENLVIAAAAVAAMFMLGLAAGGAAAARWAAWLAACWPTWVLAVTDLCSEHLTILLEAFALACLLRLISSRSRRTAICAGAFVGLAALTRSSAFWLFMPVAVVLLFFVGRRTWIVVLTCLALTAPYAAVVSVEDGAFVPIENLATYNANGFAHFSTNNPSEGFLRVPRLLGRVIRTTGGAHYTGQALRRMRVVMFSWRDWNDVDDVYSRPVLVGMYAATALLLVVVYAAALLAWLCAPDRRVVGVLWTWIAAYAVIVFLFPNVLEVRHRAMIEPPLLALASMTLSRIRSLQSLRSSSGRAALS